MQAQSVGGCGLQLVAARRVVLQDAAAAMAFPPGGPTCMDGMAWPDFYFEP
jgi:hypothetical protein